MSISCTKPQAASGQLDVAIALLLANSDPLAVRTLASAAHGVLADLAEAREEGSSWRSQVVEDSGLDRKEAFRILKEAQNFLKHADRDPDATLTFEEEENDHMIFLATVECGSVLGKLSTRMQAYQVWYLARYPEYLGQETEPVKKALRALPQVRGAGREESLRLGNDFLVAAIDRYDGNEEANHHSE